MIHDLWLYNPSENQHESSMNHPWIIHKSSINHPIPWIPGAAMSFLSRGASLAEVAFRRQARICLSRGSEDLGIFWGKLGVPLPKNGVFDICLSENLGVFLDFFLDFFWNFNDCRWVFRWFWARLLEKLVLGQYSFPYIKTGHCQENRRVNHVEPVWHT